MQPMPGIVFCPLAFRESTGDPIKAARLHDALKRNITLIALDPSTPPGIYMHNGQLVEVHYPKVAPQEAQSVPPFAHNAKSVELYDWRQGPRYNHPGAGSRQITVFSAAVPSTIPSQASHITAAKTAEVRVMDTGEVQRGGCPFAFMLTMSFADIINGQLDWMCLQGSTKRVDFLMFIDTGGQLTTWAYSATHGIYTIHGTGPVPLNQGEWKTYLDLKAKIRNLSQDPRLFRISYAGGSLCVDFQPLQPAMTSITDRQHNWGVEIPAFNMGATLGFSPNVLNYPFDGIVGLGRSHPGQNPLGTPGLVQQMFNTRRILRPIFFVCLRYLPRQPYGYGFVSFGGWPEEIQPAPVFTELANYPQAADGKWVVRLMSINIVVQGQRPGYFYINRPVELDTGTSHSVLPSTPVNGIRKYFLPAGLQDMVVPPDAEVELVFESVTYTGGPTSLHSVRGSAEAFLLTPPLAPVGSDQTQHYTLLPSDDDQTEWNLGVNFFRAFIVGFDDSPDAPKIMLARQFPHRSAAHEA